MINNHVSLSNLYKSVETKPNGFIIDAMRDDDWEAVRSVYLDRAPTSALVRRSAPRWRWRTMFSSTTIARAPTAR